MGSMHIGLEDEEHLGRIAASLGATLDGGGRRAALPKSIGPTLGPVR
jgi:hypothetical protein